jgi:hypothetical protein
MESRYLTYAFGFHGERLVAGGPRGALPAMVPDEDCHSCWTFHDNDANRLLTAEGQDEGGFRA